MHQLYVLFADFSGHGLQAALGAIDDFSFESFRMKKGEIVLAYTDGVIEAQNDHGEIFGVNRHETCLAENYQNKKLLEIRC